MPGCDRELHTTRKGDPYAVCAPHWHSLSRSHQQKLWQAFRTWQRLEKRYLALPVAERPGALLDARALAIKDYLDVRDDCIRALTPRGQQPQMEMA